MLDFAQLPPELNSLLMYAGPGSGSMLAAAANWKALAAELYAAASSYGSLVTDLTNGPWVGSSAAAMAAAAAPQVVWLTNTAGQAEQAAAQAVAAADAYEAAFGATVPPPAIAANRTLLMGLSAANFLGQNTAAIAVLEAQYAEMWAQDATAMYTYSAASAEAAVLTSFNPAAVTANPDGWAGQAAAVGRALGEAMSAQGLDGVPKALLSLAGLTKVPPWLTNPALAFGLTGHTWNANGDGVIVGGLLGDLVKGLTGSATVDASTGFEAFIRLLPPTRLLTTAFKDIQGLAQTIMPAAGKAAESVGRAIEALPQAISGSVGGAEGGLGKAMSVGGLSVPVSWTGVVPSATPVSVALDGLGAAAAAEPAASAFGGVPVVPGAGGGRMMASQFVAPRYGFKPTVIPHPPAGG